MVEKCECTGCSACQNICPVDAIKMKPDNEGFLHPQIISEHCIDCGACKNVCPVGKKFNEQEKEPIVYAAKAKDKSIQMQSASGGIFPILAKAILHMGGVVWGASFNVNFDVCHSCVTNEEDLPSLCRSKYVQSNLCGIYEIVKTQLKDGKSVLFTGTPCQTAALASFVGGNLRKNLFLVDIVCHGVPSPMIWKEFLKELNDSKNENIQNISMISFKYKDAIRKWNHPGFCIAWHSGKEYLEYSNRSWYENGYLGNLYVRPSCHVCKFKNLNSPSDLMIGDFWGCKDLLPEMYDEDGVSVVFVKTKKGSSLFAEIQNQIRNERITFDIAIRQNPRIIESAMPNKNREKFWRCYMKQSEKTLETVGDIVHKCTRGTFLDWVRRKIIEKKRIWQKIR